MRKFLVIALAGLVLAGCASGAKPGAMMVPLSDATFVEKESPLFQSVQVAETTGGKKTNPMWTSEVSNEDFSEALRQSLSAHTILAAQGGKYRLSATLVELKQPMFGFDMKVTAKVRYKLEKVDGGAVLFDEELSSEYVAKMGDAFLGAERLRLANEGAIRTSIQDMLKLMIELSKSDPRFKDTAQPLAMQIKTQLLG